MRKLEDSTNPSTGQQDLTAVREALGTPADGGSRDLISRDGTTNISIGDGKVDLEAAGAPDISIGLEGSRGLGHKVASDMVAFPGSSKQNSVFAQSIPGGVRFLAVIKDNDAAQNLRWSLVQEEGSRLVPQADGSIHIDDVKGSTKYVIQPAWAKDAVGRDVPSHYIVAGDVITQELDTRGATFPIVADPSVTLGWRVYIHLNPKDQRALAQGAGAAAAFGVATAVCAAIGPGGIICGAGAAAAAAVMASYVGDYYNPKCTLVLKFKYLGTYDGHSYEKCKK